MGIVVILMGLLMIVVGIYFQITGTEDSTLETVFVFIGIGAMVSVMGFILLSSTVKILPFKIYERGFSPTKASFLEGLRGHDRFITWNRIKSVAFETRGIASIGIREIKIRYDDDKEENLNYTNMDDPFEVIKIFNKYVPEKMDERFKVYIGKVEERKVITSPIPLKPVTHKWAILLLVTIFLLVMSGTVAPNLLSTKKGLSYSIIILIMFISMAFFMFWLSIPLDKRAQNEVIRYKARATPIGIEIPSTFYGKVIRKVRPSIPYDEIKIVKMKLDPIFLAHEAEFETVRGEKNIVPYSVYERISNLEGFELLDYNFVNKSPAHSRGPLFKFNKSRVLILTILLSLTFFVGPIFRSEIIQIISETQYMLIGVVFLVLIPLLFVAYWFVARRSRTSAGMSATESGIFLPNAPEKFRNISKNEFISAKVGKDIFGYYCELNGVQGQVKLTQLAAENLIHAGYPVANAEGLGQIPLGGWVKYKEKAAKIKKEEPPKIPKKLEPGNIIWEESAESVSVRMKKFATWAKIIGSVGVVLFIIPLIVTYYLQYSLSIFLSLILGSLGITLLVIGIIMIAIVSRVKPLRVHENGISFSELMTKEGSVFVPYGRIKTYTENKVPIWGDVIMFHLEGLVRFVAPKSIPDFTKVFTDIKDKLGRPEYDSIDFQVYPEYMFKKMSSIYFGACFVIGYLASLMFLVIYGYSSIQSLITRILMYGSAITILLIVYFTYILGFNKMNLPFRGKLKAKPIAAMIITTLILFGVGWVMYVPDLPEIAIYQDNPPSSFVYGSGVIEDMNLTLQDNIYVTAGKNLAIRNANIIFNLTYNKQYSIYVDQNGRIEIINSTLTTNNDNYGYGFEIYGSAKITDSRFSNLYGPYEYENGDGGLEIYSDDVVIRNSTFTENQVNSILIAHASPIIENCTFENTVDDGIEIHYSSAIIRNNSFRNNGWAIGINPRGAALIENNYFYENSHGMFVHGASPTIRNNEFRNTDRYAIAIFEGAYPKLENNIYENNGEDVRRDIGYEAIFSICSVVVILAGVIATGIILLKIRQNRNKTKETNQL